MSRDQRLDRLEDKMDAVMGAVTRMETHFDGLPGRIRQLENQALQWETGRRLSLWLLSMVAGVAGAIGAAIGWVIKVVGASTT